MKKLIDYNHQELEHVVKYHEFYKITSYVMFLVIILLGFYWSLAEDSARYYKGMLDIQDSCYTNALEQQKLSIDTAKWYKEMGVKIEKDLEY
jgi:hypothetical protein